MYNRLGHPAVLAILVIVLFVIPNTFFRVREGTQALIFQFGRIVREPITETGLHVKVPFIQNVQLLEKRILNWDGNPTEMPTKGGKLIIVDTTARWKIDDAVKFRNRLEDEKSRQAQDVFTKIIDSATRKVISGNNLVETVRNTNQILENIRKLKEQQSVEDAEAEVLEEIISDIPKVSQGREKLSQKIIELARPKLSEYGIELIDVQLRRIAYNPTVEEDVYDRMISERQRIAEKLRSMGKGEYARIQGKTNKELQQIKSEAYKREQEILGSAQAKAIKIYADAVGENEEIYKFLRTIEAYKDGLRDDTKLILSADSAFFKLLTEGQLPSAGK